MENPKFVDAENITLVAHYDENRKGDYRDCNTLNTSTITTKSTSR